MALVNESSVRRVTLREANHPMSDPGAEIGDFASLEFVGRTESGRPIERTEDGAPFELEIGAPLAVPGFWRGLLGRRAGEEFTLRIAPEDGYGLRDERLVRRSARADLPSHVVPGSTLRARADERDLVLRVVAFEGDEAVLDGNHPLAGETLVYEVKIQSIRRKNFEV